MDVEKANPFAFVFEDYVVLRLDFLRDLLVREERLISSVVSRSKQGHVFTLLHLN